MNLKLFVSTWKQYRWKVISRIIKSCGRKLGFFVEGFYLMKFDLSKFTFSKDIRILNAIEISDIDKVDLKAFKFSPYRIELFKERINSNTHSCYGYIQDNEIVYLTWVSWKKMNYPSFFEIVEDLKVNQALLEDSYCLPEYRGKGIHSAMNEYRLRKLFERGKKEALVLILKENTPALKVQTKSGFKIDSVIFFKKFFSQKQIIKKPYEDTRKRTLF